MLDSGVVGIMLLLVTPAADDIDLAGKQKHLLGRIHLVAQQAVAGVYWTVNEFLSVVRLFVDVTEEASRISLIKVVSLTFIPINSQAYFRYPNPWAGAFLSQSPLSLLWTGSNGRSRNRTKNPLSYGTEYPRTPSICGSCPGTPGIETEQIQDNQ